jgi:hypothetical protein
VIILQKKEERDDRPAKSAICNKNKLKIEEARQYAIPRVAVNILIVKIPGKDFVLFYNFYHWEGVHTAYHKPNLLNFTYFTVHN